MLVGSSGPGLVDPQAPIPGPFNRHQVKCLDDDEAAEAVDRCTEPRPPSPSGNGRNANETVK